MGDRERSSCGTRRAPAGVTMRALLLFSFFTVVLLACASKTETTLHVSEYSTACTADKECVLAINGDVYQPCANAAFARSDARYAADRARLRESCPSGAGVTSTAP